MGLFERYLTVWVGLGILAGVGLGLASPDLFQVIAGIEYAHVNLIVAVFMHLAWERLALICAILLPPLALVVLVWLMASEAGYVHLTRLLFFR